RWSPAQLKLHLEAASILRATVFEAFALIKAKVSGGHALNEFEVQQFILAEFERHRMVTNSPPIVAVNEHSASPHYQPTLKEHSPIKSGDLVLLDIWAKKRAPADAVYADITWTGYVGEAVPERYREIFAIVAGARDAALAFVQSGVRERRQM